MKIFDKAKYQLGGSFPSDLPKPQAFVVTGFFVAWCAVSALLSLEIRSQFSDNCARLIDRTTPPCELYRALGGVFSESQLTDIGFDFSNYYFDFDVGAYLDDFIDALATNLPSAFHVADTWENFDTLRVLIAARFENWAR